jgi:hypothetical protein
MSEKYEEWHAFVAAHLDAPVEQDVRDYGTWLTSGQPPDVVVRLTDSSVTVFEYAMEGQGPYTPVVRPRRVGSIVWRRLPDRAAMKAIQALIDGAREARHARFADCTRCGTRQPPEWMEDGVCRSCAEGESGVVH